VLAALTAKQLSLNAIRPDQFSKVAQYLSLVQLDNNWSTHLGRMNLLKESVVMSAKYLQRDPVQVGSDGKRNEGIRKPWSRRWGH